MILLFTRPTGRELRPRLVSMWEVVMVALLVLGSGLAAGLWLAREYDLPREEAGAGGAITIMLAVLIYFFIRSRLVRQGVVHPVGMIADQKDHAGCRCER